MKTKELVQNYYKAFNSKNYQGMIELLSDDVAHDINQGKRITGKQNFVNFLADMDQYYDENLTDICIMIDDSGKYASAEFICSGIYKSTCEGLPPARNQKYSLPVGCFFTIEEGRITRVTNYYNMKVWLDQVK